MTLKRKPPVPNVSRREIRLARELDATEKQADILAKRCAELEEQLVQRDDHLQQQDLIRRQGEHDHDEALARIEGWVKQILAKLEAK